MAMTVELYFLEVNYIKGQLKGNFFLINMFVYSCNVRSNTFYNSIICNYRLKASQNCGRGFAVIIAEALSRYISSSGSVCDDKGSSMTTRDLLLGLSSLSRTIIKSLAMPQCCVAAACKTTSRMGYSLHLFPTDKNMGQRCCEAIQERMEQPLDKLPFVLRHFTEDPFETEESLYHDPFGIPAQNRLKPDAVPTIFP